MAVWPSVTKLLVDILYARLVPAIFVMPLFGLFHRPAVIALVATTLPLALFPSVTRPSRQTIPSTMPVTSLFLIPNALNTVAWSEYFLSLFHLLWNWLSEKVPQYTIATVSQSGVLSTAA